jgi:PAS domain S-box-containing protein
MNPLNLLISVAQALLANSPAGIAVYAGDTGACLLANEMLAENVGGSVEALLRQHFRDLASWRDSGLADAAESTLSDGVPRHREVAMQTSFDKNVLLDSFFSRFDFEGRPHLMLIAIDVTERRRAEQALAVREKELHTLIDTVPDLIVRYDRELRRTYVNPAWEQASGLSAKDVINVPAAAIPKVPTPAHGGYVQKVRQVLESGTPQSIGFTWVNAFGAELYLEYIIVPEHDRSGAITGVLAVGRDLSERRRAEDALTRLNRELRAISDCNQVLVRAEDEQTLLGEICRIVCTGAGYRMACVGYAENDAVKSVQPVAWGGVEDKYLEQARLSWADTERGRGPAGTAIRDGSTDCSQDIATDPRMAPWRDDALQRGYRSLIALPLKDEHAHVFGVFLIYSPEPDAFTPDEIRLLEELAGDLAFGVQALRNRNARKESEWNIALLSFALNNVREAAYLIDEQARFLYVNEESCRMLGYDRDELLTLSIPDIDPDVPMERWLAHWAELKNRGSLFFEERHKTKDGRAFPVEISANYLEYDGQGYNLAMVRDITERKHAEEMLHLQTVELEEEVAERQVAQENLQEKAQLLEEEIEKRQKAQEELEQLNERLEQRVKERTTELEEKNAELYKMNRLFVNRELRMVELKERIRELGGSNGN